MKSWIRVLTVQDSRVNKVGALLKFPHRLSIHLCLGEDGGHINAVEATDQNTNDKKVQDEADEVNPTLLFTSASRYFLLDPLFFQIRLGVKKTTG